MAWVAMDRAIRLAEKRSFPADIHRWRLIRDEIFMEIMEKGWNKERQAFVQHYGTRTGVLSGHWRQRNRSDRLLH
jgi:GH15 family glucan-1,4-alpha-glucosidase